MGPGGGYSIYDVGGYGDAAKEVKTPIEPDNYLQDVFFQTRPEVIDFDGKDPQNRNPFYQVRDDFEIEDGIKDEFQYTNKPQNWDKQEPQLVKPKYRNKYEPKSSVQNIMNLYSFDTNAITFELDHFSPLHEIRTAKTLNDLLRATRYFKIKERGKRCRVHEVKSDLKNKYWEFSVKGNEVWSSPHPHLVQIKLLTNPRIKDIRQLHVKVTCDCDYWKYQGPDFNAHQQHFLLDRPKSNGAAPNIRDKNRVNLICKHVWAVGQIILEYAHRHKLDTFEEVDNILNTLSKKNVTQMPEALREISENLEGTERRKLEPIIKKMEAEKSPQRLQQLSNQAMTSLEDILSKKDKGFLSGLLDSILKFLGIRKSNLDRKPLVANILEIYSKENLETYDGKI